CDWRAGYRSAAKIVLLMRRVISAAGLNTLTARVVRASASRVKRSNDENDFTPSRFVYYHLVTLSRVKVQRWDSERVPDANYRDSNNFSHFNSQGDQSRQPITTNDGTSRIPFVARHLRPAVVSSVASTGYCKMSILDN